MKFNYDKCKGMHFGKRNREKEYSMEIGLGQKPHNIEKILFEKDLG